jgi:hypothetical protein
MARNALEAVFGALGGGLVGYGKDKQNRYAQEQDAIDREERRKRTELADVLKAAEMMQSGSYGTDSQLQSRQQGAGRTAMQAAMFAATAGKGPPSAAPMPTDVARAVPQLRRGMDAPSVSIGGQNLRMLETEPERALITRAARMEDDSFQRQQAQRDLQARDVGQGAQRLREIQESGRQARLTQAERPVPFNARANEGWRGALPAASKNRLEMSEASLNQLAYLKQAVLERPDAVGLKNYAPGAVIDRLDPQGADIRATIELISGEIRNARFGGALTKTEAAFALRSLPDATQRADVVLSRITALERFLEERRRGVFGSYNQPYTPFQTTDLTNASADDVGDANPLAVGGSAADRLRSGRYP